MKKLLNITRTPYKNVRAAGQCGGQCGGGPSCNGGGGGAPCGGGK